MQAVVRRRMVRPRAAAQRAQALPAALQRAVIDELHDEHGVRADEVPAAARDAQDALGFKDLHCNPRPQLCTSQQSCRDKILPAEAGAPQDRRCNNAHAVPAAGGRHLQAAAAAFMQVLAP